MIEQRDDAEPECIRCGLLESDCTCTLHEPTPEDLEIAREERLSRLERERGGR